MNTFARFISTIFAPPVILVTGGALIAHFLGQGNLFAFTLFVLIGKGPATALQIWRNKSHKSLIFNIGRKSRDAVYLLLLLGFSLLSVIFGSQLFATSTWLESYRIWELVAMILAIYFGVFWLVNRSFDKASQHVGMMCLWAMILMNLVNVAFAVSFAFLPLVIWSRIEQHKHTWIQIFLGMLIGMSVGMISWLIIT